MNSYRMNGAGASQYETPFGDAQIMTEQPEEKLSAENLYSNYSQEIESPFSRTYTMTPQSSSLTPLREEYINFVGELNDSEFNEVVYALANEVEETWRSKVSDEIAMGNNYLPFATQQARAYFAPLLNGSKSMIDKVAEHFSGNNLSDHSDSEVDSFFETIEFNHEEFTPVQDQFFGKIFDKVKSAVKKGIDVAKKGASIIGKLNPLNLVLNKIKGLVNPLLEKVLKFALGKLPKNLQPYAQTLAKKFLNLDIAVPTTETESSSDNELDAIQTELDNHIAQLVFSPSENEADNLVMSYETSYENVERQNSYEAGYNQPSLDVARQQFINELKELNDGESPAPAIERFLPVAIMALQPLIKMALKLVGRQKIINFLAGLLAKLVGKYVPANVAQPLSTSIIETGLSSIGFEVHEMNKPEVGYEAIANTIQETIQNMTDINEASLNDTEDLTMQLLEAFETAAANNFPAQYIKEELRPTKQKAVWVAMPRHSRAKLYKKFTHIYDITIEPQTADSVITFRNLPLSKFLKDKYGLDTSKPIRAKVHLYETNKGCRLSQISRNETLPELNAKKPRAWIQLLPLTTQAASLLLKEEKLGKDVDPKDLATRYKTAAGQRFYFLDIDGAKLKIPVVKRNHQRQKSDSAMTAASESHSADIQGVINFLKSEITLSYYFSEEDAKDIVEKLNKNDFLGAGISIRQSVKTILNDVLLKNISSKVKIIHEAIPEMYLERMDDNEENFALPDFIGKLAGKDLIKSIVEKLIDKFSAQAYDSVVKFFKARATEFKQAQAQPADGVTLKLTWGNITGMATIRTVINALRGDLSIGNLSDLSIPNFPSPEFKIEAGKKLD